MAKTYASQEDYPRRAYVVDPEGNRLEPSEPTLAEQGATHVGPP